MASMSDIAALIDQHIMDAMILALATDLDSFSYDAAAEYVATRAQIFAEDMSAGGRP